MGHKIALASGVVVGSTPEATVEAAAAGGFDALGLWVEPRNWTSATTAAVRHRVADLGLSVLDVEVVWIKPGPDDPDHFRTIDIGAEVGAENVLVVASDPDHNRVAERFQKLCEHAGPAGLRVALEFGYFTDVRTVQEALGVLAKVNHPAKSILIDTLHLNRSGGTASQVAAIPRDLIAYAQLCDAGPNPPDRADRTAIREEAVDRRLQLGDGVLPLVDVLRALPASLPLSIELRSKALRDNYPDVNERARVVAESTLRFLARADLPTAKTRL
jgi:sugar phosphate isomerase/epimerase